jgi:hypothetical protein
LLRHPANAGFDDGSLLVEFAEWIGVDADDPEGAEDAEEVLIHLRGLHPELADPEIVALCRKYESEAKDLVAKLWPSIERLACELLLKGKLSAIEAHAAAGYPRPEYIEP